MVHIAKRMRSFQPLLAIRSGQGAALLPPPPAPQLTSVHLRWPQGPWKQEIVRGPKTFRQKHLASFQYYNPSIPITVQKEDWSGKESIILTLNFEGSDPDALRSIAQKSSDGFKLWKAPQKPQKPRELFDSEEAARGQSPNFRDAPAREPEKSSEPSKITADDDQVVLKPQPAAEPSSPATTSPPQPVYTRSVTLPLNGRRAKDIWKWFQMRTKCERPPMAPEDSELRTKLKAFAVKSDEDRRRVKIAVDAMKREKEDLKRAREAAERLAAEAA